MTDLFRLYNGHEFEQEVPVIPQVPVSFYGPQRSWEPISEYEESGFHGNVVRTSHRDQSNIGRLWVNDGFVTPF